MTDPIDSVNDKPNLSEPELNPAHVDWHGHIKGGYIRAAEYQHLRRQFDALKGSADFTRLTACRDALGMMLNRFAPDGRVLGDAESQTVAYARATYTAGPSLAPEDQGALLAEALSAFYRIGQGNLGLDDSDLGRAHERYVRMVSASQHIAWTLIRRIEAAGMSVPPPTTSGSGSAP